MPAIQNITPTQVAQWFRGTGAGRISLPAMQRAAVWKPAQVEALWDSMSRGFPIGSFLFAPYDSARGNRALGNAQRMQRRTDSGPTFHLLDGQQRSNAIALGYADPWLIPNSLAALWVDLAPSPKGARDPRQFIFRVLTQSHPWGYMRSDPENRLEANARRAAMAAMKQYLAADAAIVPGSADLRFAWPWDCDLPVPVSILFRACNATSTPAVLRRVDAEMSKLPFWSAPRLGPLRRFLQEGHTTPHLEQLLSGVRRLRATAGNGAYRIPVQMLQVDSPQSDDNQAVDAVETLFVRLNAGGTRLDGEELSYSILKSIWPNSEQLVESLSSRIMAPARLVMLFTRLILARASLDFPPQQDVAQFRRLVHGLNKEHPTFLRDFKELLTTGRASKLLLQATSILAINERGIGLPTVLVADIARSSPDSFLLLLRWLDRCDFEKSHIDQVSHLTRKQIIGALTTLAWYSEDSRLAVKAVWEDLEVVSERAIRSAWESKGRLRPAVRPVRGEFPLTAPISPAAFQKALHRRVRALCTNHKNKTWTTWTWTRHIDSTPPADDPAFYYLSRVLKRAIGKGDDTERADGAALMWSRFAVTTWNLRPLVLYAQRGWLNAWFSDFDPARRDQLEDTDRPWDMDHIHASNYVKNIKRPQPHLRVLRDEWHGCIGNLRAWPLELNRGDGDASPTAKLAYPETTDERSILAEYEIRSRSQLLAASVIADSSAWEASTPYNEFKTNYLKTELQCYPPLIKAITERWLGLYRGWFRDLQVQRLF
jgi:hypothetical protein